MRRFTIVAAVCVATAALVTACDSDAGTASGAPTSSGRSTSGQSTSDVADPSPVDCAETREWATKDTRADSMSTDELYHVRAGRHDCYDRLVLDINGPAEVGFLVGYVPEVTTDGAGKPVPVDGDAALQVIVRASAQGYDSGGHQPGRQLGEIGHYFYSPEQLAGWSSLRAVRFAGSFEGQSTLAVGVREKLPFRAFTQLDEADQVRKLVVDIAHDQP
ncbi:MAG: AMIN-like domain-containing (lipo)protein [Actinophytocola sp.]|uniref:AMIN-like domain-containing (lipo)protein n=1 Tax=Actinophytocola sp. TaxID=1872138 RepID=UPI003D6C5AF8